MLCRACSYGVAHGGCGTVVNTLLKKPYVPANICSTRIRKPYTRHPPQFPFSSPPCPLSFFPFFFPFHLLYLPYAFPGIWKGRWETKRDFVGNARDCQLHGSEERWSPVLLRSGSKSSEAWDSCANPPGTPSCLFLSHHLQLLQNPSITQLSEMSGPVSILRYEAGLKFPKGQGEWKDLLDDGSSLLFPQLPFLCPPCKYPLGAKNVLFCQSGRRRHRRKTCTLMRHVVADGVKSLMAYQGRWWWQMPNIFIYLYILYLRYIMF